MWAILGERPHNSDGANQFPIFNNKSTIRNHFTQLILMH